MPARTTAICIPGLGGHTSVFIPYADLLSEYNLKIVKLVDPENCLQEVLEILEKEEQAFLLCHCYGIQIGLRAAAKMPDKIAGIVVIEPFFGEFHWWIAALGYLNWLVLQISKFTDVLGMRRRNLSYEPDYVSLAKYPIYLHPVFDLLWQNLTDYLKKTEDIADFRLPQSVIFPTLFVFAANSFTEHKKILKRMKEIFLNGEFVKMEEGTHNAIIKSAGTISGILKSWFAKLT